MREGVPLGERAVGIIARLRHPVHAHVHVAGPHESGVWARRHMLSHESREAVKPKVGVSSLSPRTDYCGVRVKFAFSR